MCANLAFIGFAWWLLNGSLFSDAMGTLVALGRITALWGTALILLQIFLVARVPFLEQTFGFDRLTRLHHWSGILTFCFLVAHPILLLLGRGAEHSIGGIFAQWALWFGSLEEIAPATIALVLLTGIVVHSLLMVWRRWRYELWFATHLLVYPVVLLSFGHQLELGGDFFGRLWFEVYWQALFVIVLVSLAWYRILTPLARWWRYRFVVDRVVRETATTYSIYISGRGIGSFPYRAGQYASLRFLDRGRWWQSHPFSFSGVPGDDYLQFTIKGLGDFSGSLAALAKGTPVILEGPFGIFTLDRREHAKVLLLAGGVGISPIASLARECARTGVDAVTVYVHRPDDGALAAELALLPGIVVRDVVSGLQRHTMEQLLVGIPAMEDRDVYVCGPQAMVDDARAFAQERNIGPVHFERFSLS